jgi:hypothetical protein
LLAGTLPASALDGKVVLIGLAASGAGDQFVVPVGPRGRPQPGVLVHAAAAASILRGGLLSPATGWTVLAAAWLAAFAVQRARTLADRLDLRALAAVVALAAIAAVAALWAAEVVLPLVTVVLAAGIATAGREAVESREARRETTAVLAALLEQMPAGAPGAPPRGVAKQLELARRLQREIARGGGRQALLDRLAERGALGRRRTALLANRARANVGRTALAGEVRAARSTGRRSSRSRFGRSARAPSVCCAT